MMVGAKFSLNWNGSRKLGDEMVTIENLTVAMIPTRSLVDDVSFSVNAGEVFGLAGVQGNGQTELVEAITGMRHVAGGKVHINGQDITNASPRVITEAGTAHVPEDRQRDGLVLPFPIMDNLVIVHLLPAAFCAWCAHPMENGPDNAEKLIDEYDIRTPGPYTSAGSLSGGNQQKVIVARELSRPIKFLVASQPTRGLDVGSIELFPLANLKNAATTAWLYLTGFHQNWMKFYSFRTGSASCTGGRLQP
jgi:simple sugar transport system ATP-binding protein